MKMEKQNVMKTFFASERGKGILTVILFLVLIACLPMFAYMALTPYKNAKGLSEADFATMIAFIAQPLTVIIFVALFFKVIKEDIKRLTRKQLGLVLLLGIILPIVGNGLSTLFEYLGASAPANNEPVFDMIDRNILLTFVVIVLYGPIAEELVFRRALKQIFNNNIVFSILSVLLFSVMHLSFDWQFITFLIMGAVFTFAFLKTEQNVFASMLIHFMNNLAGFILLLIIK
jgi:membrane protease YdiL (CAAX protease family)